MPPKKRTKVEYGKDPNLDDDNVVTLSEIQSKFMKKLGALGKSFDWTEFFRRMKERTAESPRWFLAVREEDVLTAAQDAIKVESVNVLEAPDNDCLAPMHILQRWARIHADPEDNPPERYSTFKDHDFVWRKVVSDDKTTEFNAYILSDKPAALATAKSFAFGSAAALPSATPSAAAPETSSTAEPATTKPASATAGFGATATAAPPVASEPARAPTFNFGSSASASSLPSATPSFGFGMSGTSAPPPSPAAAQTGGASFAFGASNAAPPAATPPTPPQRETTASAVGFGGASSFGSKDTCPEVKASNAIFVLFEPKRITDVLKEMNEGSRIVIPNFDFGDGVKGKLTMQSDKKDKPDRVADDWCKARFAKTNKSVQRIDEWAGSIPEHVPEMIEAIQDAREDYIERLVEENEDQYQAIEEKHKALIVSKLKQCINDREEKEYRKEKALLEEARDLLKKGRLLPVRKFKTRKFYADNAVIGFNCSAKISGIHESGQKCEECWPAAFDNKVVWKNKA